MDAEGLARDFKEVAVAVVATVDDPRLDALRVTPVRSGDLVSLHFEGAPVLEVEEDDKVVPVDTTPVLQAVAWTMERRARRRAQGESFGKDDVEWVKALRDRFPGRFDCEVSVNPGWADLIFAMAERVEASEDGRQLVFTQVKEKFGTLRAYHRGFTFVTSDPVDAFEAVSGGVCETCGAPGILRRTKGGWYLTACEGHANGAAGVT